MRNRFSSGPVKAPVIEGIHYEYGCFGEKTDHSEIPLEEIHPAECRNVRFSPNAQEGVKKMEATTTAWSRKTVIVLYTLLWFVMFVDALQQNTSGALVPYVTSAFNQHSLTAYTGVMSGIIGGVLRLPLAKFIDIFGRPQGFILSVGCLILGLVLMAACNGVQMYAAAQIFYWLGYNSMVYCISVFIADTSSLRNRGFLFAYSQSPYLMTIWIAGPLAEAFLQGPGFRWAFGLFTIITFIAALPVMWIFMTNYRKAVEAGIYRQKKQERRTFFQAVKYYMIEFDAIGLILIVGGLVFCLLPFSLYTYQTNRWASPLIITFFVIGILMLIGFVLYETYIAPEKMLPFVILTDRTVLGSNVLAAILFIAFYLWHDFFSSFLQVVSGLSLVEATYVTNIYTVGSCFFSLAVGIAIRCTSRFKWIAMYFGVPLMMFGIGLMIHFRQPDQPIGYIIMCQVLISLAGGACVITHQMAAQAAVQHQYVSIIIALEGMFTSVASGIGASVSAGIWTGVFPARLISYLPEDAKTDAAAIYGSLNTQLSYPKGSPIRIAIEQAYGDAQMYMCTVACAILILGFLAVTMWRNINLADMNQTRGTVA